jgi:SAM-dependent methyltransferase
MLGMSQLRRIKRGWVRKSTPADWHSLRNLDPVSRSFGLDRGVPVDRYYIEKFLAAKADCITGAVLEIAESTYSRKFGHDVSSFEVLHTRQAPKVTMVGDLTDPASLPDGRIDCFICTQTFNFIYDFKSAIRGAFQLLRPGGVLLATLGGISQISRFDMDRWGDYWRFTTLSAEKAFSEVFGPEQVRVASQGNVLAATAFLQGIASEELTSDELDHPDDDYQLLVTVVAQKPSQCP